MLSPCSVAAFAVATVVACTTGTPAPPAGADHIGPGLRGLHIAPPTRTTTAATPRHPLVFAPGIFGFHRLSGVDYWYDVLSALASLGQTVAIAAVEPLGDSYSRGEALRQQVEEVVRVTGARAVNLICHSQGGLDCRYVAHVVPDRVAAVVTIASPHRGARLADVLLQRGPGFSLDLLAAFLGALAVPIYGNVALDADLQQALEFLGSRGVAEFNEIVTDRPEVAYYAVGARSNSLPGDEDCAVASAPEFIRRYQDDVDPIDRLLFLTGRYLLGEDKQANDGVVHVASMRWGEWLGCVPADHWDTIGQMLGDRPGGTNPFDHRAFYAGLAGFLAARGH
jgi:triacylglycerol lipase